MLFYACVIMYLMKRFRHVAGLHGLFICQRKASICVPQECNGNQWSMLEYTANTKPLPRFRHSSQGIPCVLNVS